MLTLRAVLSSLYSITIWRIIQYYVVIFDHIVCYLDLFSNRGTSNFVFYFRQQQRKVRKIMNEKDSDAMGTALDSLLNFEVFFMV
jgi:hypothetical protein